MVGSDWACAEVSSCSCQCQGQVCPPKAKPGKWCVYFIITASSTREDNSCMRGMQDMC
jgi:hypothetical protein